MGLYSVFMKIRFRIRCYLVAYHIQYLNMLKYCVMNESDEKYLFIVLNLVRTLKYSLNMGSLMSLLHHENHNYHRII